MSQPDAGTAAGAYLDADGAEECLDGLRGMARILSDNARPLAPPWG